MTIAHIGTYQNQTRCSLIVSTDRWEESQLQLVIRYLTDLMQANAMDTPVHEFAKVFLVEHRPVDVIVSGEDWGNTIRFVRNLMHAATNRSATPPRMDQDGESLTIQYGGVMFRFTLTVEIAKPRYTY